MEKSLASSERTIMIYSPRNRLIISILLCLLIIAGALFYTRPSYSDMLPGGDTIWPLPVSILLALIWLLVVLMVLILFGSAVIFNVRRLLSRKPALTIDAQGIMIRDYMPLGLVQIPWSNVASLYTLGPSNSYLYIRLKNVDEFAANYHPVQRIFIYWKPSKRAHPLRSLLRSWLFRYHKF